MTGKQKKVLHGVELKPRPIIHPKRDVNVSTEESKSRVVQAARKVMATHDKVLKALKDR
ncbi:hypothetical protein [Dyella flagellata]|uniref:hypothetical protein n=1 Tax=Dyella flagellata TaxID=1867833 RepID=UPI0024E0C4E2|nr:hypothetical protein [Dyella flagellata]